MVQSLAQYKEEPYPPSSSTISPSCHHLKPPLTTQRACEPPFALHLPLYPALTAAHHSFALVNPPRRTMVHLTRLAAFTAGLVLATASHIVSAMPLDDQVYPDLDGRTTLPLNETLEARQRNLRPRQTAVVPASPAGATLIQLQPCSGISATIPAFVNSKWAQVGQVSDATSVYISQHGAGADFDR